MTAIKWILGCAMTLSVAACDGGLTPESAKAVAQERINEFIVSEKLTGAKSVLTREEHFPQGWYFEYQIANDKKEQTVTVLVGDRGNVEISRELKR